MQIKRFYSTRSDGQLTGTWYVGHRSRARVTARVYDKQAEALDVRGQLIEPTTRYELTFKRDIGCTLRDAHMPSSLFYEYASPTLLDRPDGIPDWKSHGEGWDAEPAVHPLTFERFRKRVEESPEIEALADMAEELGPGATQLLIGILEKRMNIIAQQKAQAREEADG